eukprot:148794-Pelagomonas_calceolata.AAC.1
MEHFAKGDKGSQLSLNSSNLGGQASVIHTHTASNEGSSQLIIVVVDFLESGCAPLSSVWKVQSGEPLEAWQRAAPVKPLER